MSVGTPPENQNSISQLKQAIASQHNADEDEGGHGGGGGGHESDEHLWLYSFNDMLFNLLLFFIVMYAISSVNKSKFAAVAEAMQMPKSQKESGRPVSVQRKNSVVKSETAIDTFVQCTNPLVPTRKEGTESGKQGTFPGKAPSDYRGENPMQRNKISETVLQGGEIFKAGSAVLTTQGRKTILALGKKIVTNGKVSRIEIESVVKSRDVLRGGKSKDSSSELRNRGWELASSRAKVVLDFLTLAGVSESLILVSAKGPSVQEKVSVDSLVPSENRTISAGSAKVVVRQVEAWGTLK